MCKIKTAVKNSNCSIGPGYSFSLLDVTGNRKMFRQCFLASSLRDGFVPRKQQRFIEHTVRKAIETNLSKRFIRSETIFDENLVGGKEGWK